MFVILVIVSAILFWLQAWNYGLGERKIVIKSRICEICDEVEVSGGPDRTQALLPERHGRRKKTVTNVDSGASVHIHPTAMVAPPVVVPAPETGGSSGSGGQSEYGASGYIEGFGYWTNPPAEKEPPTTMPVVVGTVVELCGNEQEHSNNNNSDDMDSGDHKYTLNPETRQLYSAETLVMLTGIVGWCSTGRSQR